MRVLSFVRSRYRDDIVTRSGELGPVAWTDEDYGGNPYKDKRSREMLRQIFQEFTALKAAVPTHFWCKNEYHELIEARFNQPRLCSLIREGYLRANIKEGFVRSVKPTAECRKVVSEHTD